MCSSDLADIVKRAMISIDGWLAGLAGRAAMLMQVHDELVFEVEDDFVDALIAGARDRMAAAAELRVPLEVNLAFGPSWADAKS